MKIYFATDHAGYQLKNHLLAYVRDELGYAVEDCGAYVLNDEDDYNDFVNVAAGAVQRDPENARAIILGGSGQGEAMAANRANGVRAAVYYGGSDELVRLSRSHNNANVLSLGARFVDMESARHAVKVWLETNFSHEERHARRNEKLDTAN